MREQRERYSADASVLHDRAVCTPLPDAEAERFFHENMMRVAAAQERKADRLADPDVPLLEAYEEQLEGITESYERRLRAIAGEDYEDVAFAYLRGERDDRVGALAAYYYEGLWRMQQRITVTDAMFFPIILRYPECVTVNIRFTDATATTASVLYESPEHADADLADEHAAQYLEESHYTQAEAAAYIRERAAVIREQFPDPNETPFEDRKYGGIVSGGGRDGAVFSSMLEPVTPDPERFDDPPTEPTLVPAGPEARRTELKYLPDDAAVI